MNILRTVYLTLLTLVCYGFFMFLQHRIFIFPIPANDYIALIILAYLLFIEKKGRKEGLLILTYAFLHFIQNPYNFELFLATEKIEFLNRLYFFDITQLLSYLALIGIMIRLIILNLKDKYNSILIFGLVLFILSLFFYDFTFNFLQLFAFVCLFIFYSLKNNQTQETERIYLPQAFWLLCSGLKLSLIITLYFVA